MNAPLIVSAAVIALLTLEVIKVVVRKLTGQPDYSLPKKFYDLAIPFFTAGWGLVFSFVPELGFPAPPPEELISVQGLFQWGLAILVEMVFYFNGVQPYKKPNTEPQS